MEEDLTGELTGEYSEVTASSLEDNAKDGLVIRALQVKALPSGRRLVPTFDTTISLFSICRINGGAKTTRSLCEILYGVTEPFVEPSTGFQVTLHGTESTGWFDYFDRVVIPGWRRRVPLWLPNEPVVAVRSGSRGPGEVGYGRVGFLKHYFYLLQRISYEIEIQTDAAQELRVIFHQLDAFLRERVEEWERTIGG